jgi:hypothetical protein
VPASSLRIRPSPSQTISLSTGKPKTTDNLYRTVFLLTRANKVSDVIEVETKDYCKLNVKLSYRVNFEGDDPEKWFAVDNYVKFLCDHMRSKIRNAVQKIDVPDVALLSGVVPEARPVEPHRAARLGLQPLRLERRRAHEPTARRVVGEEPVEPTLDLVNGLGVLGQRHERGLGVEEVFHGLLLFGRAQEQELPLYVLTQPLEELGRARLSALLEQGEQVLGDVPTP